MPARLDYRSLPIFINARDLLVPLRRMVRWLLDAGYHRIYILDNDSSYPPLLDYYQAMRADVQVIPLGANVGHTAIWDLNVPQALGVTGPYVYTDPDIVPVDECPPHVLGYFLDVLAAYPDRTKVGFGLKIDDLPDHYRFKEKVITWESQFWERRLAPKVYDAPVDTTFALYRPGAKYDLSAVRTGFPYVARHHPWYEDSANPSEDQAYYLKHARPGINNWSASQLQGWLENLIEQRAAARANSQLVPA